MGGVNLYGGHVNNNKIAVNTTWKKVFVMCARLSNGDMAWIADVYKNYHVRHLTATCIETISSEEYVIRKLAGTLKTEIELSSR